MAVRPPPPAHRVHVRLLCLTLALALSLSSVHPSNAHGSQRARSSGGSKPRKDPAAERHPPGSPIRPFSRDALRGASGKRTLKITGAASSSEDEEEEEEEVFVRKDGSGAVPHLAKQEPPARKEPPAKKDPPPARQPPPSKKEPPTKMAAPAPAPAAGASAADKIRKAAAGGAPFIATPSFVASLPGCSLARILNDWFLACVQRIY